MGILIKFNCWACDKSPCMCSSSTYTSYEPAYESETNPKVKFGDKIFQDNIEYLICEVQKNGKTKKKNIETFEESLLTEPYCKIDSFYATEKENN